jgi:DNA polymerase/3'-5' exonuclease PolX
MTNNRRTSVFLRLTRLPGVGDKLAKQLILRDLTTRARLKSVIDELPSETQVHLRYKITQTIPLSKSKALAAELRRRLVLPDLRPRQYSVLTVGSIRRNCATSKDLDLLVIVPENADIKKVLSSAKLRVGGVGDTLTITETYASGGRRRSFVVETQEGEFYTVDLFLATLPEKPYAVFHYTNGREYNVRIRSFAKKKGWRLNQYGLFRAESVGNDKDKRVPGSERIKTEHDLFRFLGVTPRPPRNRSKGV